MGSNETASVLLLLIVMIWFMTTERFQKFVAVIKE